MIKVAAITSGLNTPSSRYRVRQHLSSLNRKGIIVREYYPVIEKYAPPPVADRDPRNVITFPIRAAWKLLKILVRAPGVIGSWQADITWLERELHPGYLTLEPLLNRPLVFDVDDATWLSPPMGKTAMRRISKSADLIIAGNSFIADWFRQYAKEVCVIPTAVDTSRLAPGNKLKGSASDGPFRVGWIGTSGNHTYLYSIEPALHQFLSKADAEFWIISNAPPHFKTIHPKRIRFFKWSPQLESTLLPQLEVGLMPLFFDDWCRGKCSFKMLQYMAAEVPVVATPVGMSFEVLSLGNVGIGAKRLSDWVDALIFLYKNRSIGKQYGENGRRIVEKNYSLEIVSERLAKIFKNMV